MMYPLLPQLSLSYVYVILSIFMMLMSVYDASSTASVVAYPSSSYCILGVRLKGGVWDANKPIFVYITLNHVKYALPNGDCGIFRGIDVTMYACRVHNNSLHCLDREGKMRILEIDPTEALFKLALEKKDYADVMRMVKHSRLCGQAIITYLQDKGYPEVALHFVHDNKTRFKLALACGNIQIAMNVAYELGKRTNLLYLLLLYCL